MSFGVTSAWRERSAERRYRVPFFQQTPKERAFAVEMTVLEVPTDGFRLFDQPGRGQFTANSFERQFTGAIVAGHRIRAGASLAHRCRATERRDYAVRGGRSDVWNLGGFLGEFRFELHQRACEPGIFRPGVSAIRGFRVAHNRISGGFSHQRSDRLAVCRGPDITRRRLDRQPFRFLVQLSRVMRNVAAWNEPFRVRKFMSRQPCQGLNGQSRARHSPGFDDVVERQGPGKPRQSCRG